MRILCIDDSVDILEVLGLSLRMRWPEAEVLKAEDGPTALTMVERETPDLVIVDLGLPGMDGYEIIRRIRLFSTVPIIVLSVRDEEQDIVKALEMGADDYITKPFGHLQLLARIQAIIRRTAATPNGHEETTDLGKLRIEPSTRRVYLRGKPVALTPTEYTILYHLARNADRVLTHQALITKVWGTDAADGCHLLTVHMNNLRSKLGEIAGEPLLIITERGVGYRLAKN